MTHPPLADFSRQFHGSRVFAAISTLAICICIGRSSDLYAGNAETTPSGTTTKSESPASHPLNRQPVLLESFVQLRSGLKVSEVHKLLGADGEFGFSYIDEEGRIWRFESYTVVLDLSAWPHVKYMPTCSLLYQDGALFALFTPDDVEEFYKLRRERRPRQAHPGVPQEVAFDDDANILQWHYMKSQQGDAIAGAMDLIKQSVTDAEDYWQRKIRNKVGDPVLGVIIGIAGLFTEEIDYGRLARQNEEFDPNKIEIGMSEETVNRIFGFPLYREQLDVSQSVGLYGPKDPELPYSVEATAGVSPTMVLFQDQAAVRVLSNRCINFHWKSKIWPELFLRSKDVK